MNTTFEQLKAWVESKPRDYVVSGKGLSTCLVSQFGRSINDEVGSTAGGHYYDNSVPAIIGKYDAKTERVQYLVDTDRRYTLTALDALELIAKVEQV